VYCLIIIIIIIIIIIVVVVVVVIIIIIIITVRHQLCLDRPVSSQSNSPFKGLPSHLPPCTLQLSTIFANLLLSIPFTHRSQFDLHLPSLLSAGSAFGSYKISIVLFDVKKGDCRRTEESLEEFDDKLTILQN
jgi:hypothetical protein